MALTIKYLTIQKEKKKESTHNAAVSDARKLWLLKFSNFSEMDFEVQTLYDARDYS